MPSNWLTILENTALLLAAVIIARIAFDAVWESRGRR